MNPRLGISGRIAAYFQSAQITPLLALVALLLGVFAVLVTPREEEPQINVTMANVLIPFPGASARDVEQMVATPAEQVLSQIAGVEHVISVSQPGPGGDHRAVRGRRAAHRGAGAAVRHVIPTPTGCPPGLGVGEPIVKPKGIDDVPIVTLTLLTANAGSAAPFDLERVAHSVEAELKRVPGTREVADDRRPGPRGAWSSSTRRAWPATGVDRGRPRARRCSRRTVGMPVGELARRQPRGARRGRARSCATRATSRELVVGVHDGRPVFLQDVATRARRRRCRRSVMSGTASRQGRAGRRVSRPSPSQSPRSRARTRSTSPTR